MGFGRVLSRRLVKRKGERHQKPLQGHQILNLLSEARDRTRILMDTSGICFHCATTGTPSLSFKNKETEA